MMRIGLPDGFRACHIWARQKQTQAWTHARAAADTARSACPDVWTPCERFVHSRVATVRLRLVQSPLAQTGCTLGLTGLVYVGLARAAPQRLHLPVPLEVAGLVGVAMLQRLYSRNAAQAAACLLGAIAGGTAMVLLVSTNLWAVLPAAILGAAACALWAERSATAASGATDAADDAVDARSAQSSDDEGPYAGSAPGRPCEAERVEPVAQDAPVVVATPQTSHLVRPVEPADCAPCSAAILRGAPQAQEPLLARRYKLAQTRLAARLLALEHPFSTFYKDKGFDLIKRMPAHFDDEDAPKALVRLEQFLSLTQSLSPLAHTTAARQAYRAKLARALDAMEENDAVKEKLLNATSMHMRRQDAATLVCIVGDSGTGKTSFANIAGAVNGALTQIDMPSISVATFTGSDPVWKNSEVCRIASAIAERPEQFVVVHIDEIQHCSTDHQKALLSLLEPANSFVDQHFQVPINKSRLFIICTMIDTHAQDALLPDLYNRLVGSMVRTSALTPNGRSTMAYKTLTQRCLAANLRVADKHRRHMAAEMVRLCPSDSPGRFIAGQANKLVETAVGLEDRGRTPQVLDRAFAARVLRGTWGTLHEPLEPRSHPRPTVLQRLFSGAAAAVPAAPVITLTGWRMPAGSAQMSWFVPVDDTWTLHATLHASEDAWGRLDVSAECTGAPVQDISRYVKVCPGLLNMPRMHIVDALGDGTDLNTMTWTSEEEACDVWLPAVSPTMLAHCTKARPNGADLMVFALYVFSPDQKVERYAPFWSALLKASRQSPAAIARPSAQTPPVANVAV